MHVCGPSVPTPSIFHNPQKMACRIVPNYMGLEQQNKTKQSPFARAGAMAQQVRALAERSHQFPAPTWQLTPPVAPAHLMTSSGLPWHYAYMHKQTQAIGNKKIFFKIYLQSRYGGMLL